MRTVFGLAALAVLFGIAGCSGGGGSAGNLAGGRASVPVFVTDSPETDNDHVWVTIYKVERGAFKPANAVTLSRGLLILPIFGLLWQGHGTAALGLYVLAALTDASLRPV